MNKSCDSTTQSHSPSSASSSSQRAGTTADHTAHSAARQTVSTTSHLPTKRTSTSAGEIPRNLDAAEWTEQDQGALGQILHRARAFDRINRIASQSLPEALARHSRIACIRDQTLIIQADSAAWGTRVRLQGEEWLQAVRQYWPGPIRQLKIKVKTPLPTPTTPSTPRVLSDSVCAHLEQCANNQHDEEMAAILHRLAQYSAHSSHGPATNDENPAIEDEHIPPAHPAPADN